MPIYDLTSGRSKGCGCGKSKRGRFKQLRGIYGRLWPLIPLQVEGGKMIWGCVCMRCDKYVEKSADAMLRARAAAIAQNRPSFIACDSCEEEKRVKRFKSKRDKSHPLWQHTWNCWHSSRRRCRNPNEKDREKYGAVTWWPPWDNFDVFLHDMERFAELHESLNRKDPTKGYSPDNCKWGDDEEQARDRQPTHIVIYHGERMALKKFARVIGATEAQYKKMLAAWPFMTPEEIVYYFRPRPPRPEDQQMEFDFKLYVI